MKKLFLSLALAAALAFSISIGHNDKSTTVVGQTELFAISSNHP